MSFDALRKKETEGNKGDVGFGGGAGGGEDDDDQNYYVGGTSNQGGGSGLNVVDPHSARGGGDPFAKIIETARRQGASPGAPGGASSSGDKPKRKVTFYKNGFRLDDGPLRERGTKENDEFLDAISRGYCPEELLDKATRQPADVAIEDRRSEEYQPPPPPAYIAFSGQGQTMGASSSQTDNAIVVGTESAPSVPVEGDESIKIRIVYPNGKKQAAAFAKSHTIRNLLYVIEQSGNVSGVYQILSNANSVQPKPIPNSQFNETLANAKLGGASVTVRLV